MLFIELLKKFLHMKTAEQANMEYLLEHGMKVGKNTFIVSCMNFDTGRPWLIEIGDNSTISSNVTILTHDASTNFVGCGTKLGRVTIGNNVFVGTGTIILCDTRIGDNCVIGAGSIVTRNLESGGVYAGSPAKKICSIEEYKVRMEEKKQESPNFADIRPWNTWDIATEAEKKIMYDGLEDGPGFY